MPYSPLPKRHGLDAAWVRSPSRAESLGWQTMAEFLAWKIPRLSPARISEMIAEHRFVFQNGEILTAHSSYLPNTFVFFHRDLPVEAKPPGELNVLYRDDRIVVLDKPHFMVTIPRGRHVRYSVVVQGRQLLGLPELSPAHRLDRLTAGVLLCVISAKYRSHYQLMFEHRKVRKTYLALANWRADLPNRVEVVSRIRKEPGRWQVHQTLGLPTNSHSIVEFVARKDAIGCYRVTPITGKTHQVRAHLNLLGLPILNDPLYPVATDLDASNFNAPLQLLAQSLEFTDPITGVAHRFESEQTLALWPN